MDFSSVISLSSVENHKYLDQVYDLLRENYSTRELLNLCTAADPVARAEFLGRDFVQRVRSGEIISCTQLSTRGDKTIAALMSVKPYTPRNRFLITKSVPDNSLTEAEIEPARTNYAKDNVNDVTDAFISELDKAAFEYVTSNKDRDPRLKSFLQALGEIHNNEWRVVEVGRAISTKAAQPFASAILGQWCFIKAWRLGAKFAIGHVNNNGLRVALASPGYVLASLVLKDSKVLHRRESEPVNSPRLLLLHQPLQQHHESESESESEPESESKSDRQTYLTEYYILFDLDEQAQKNGWAAAVL